MNLDLYDERELTESSSNEEEENESSTKGEIREQDRYLPIANINRIMKKVLPLNAKISREAKETIQECASEFISFITSEASDKCNNDRRKTINGEDILAAMKILGFDQYINPLTLYLAKYRDYISRRTKKGDQNEAQRSRSPSSLYLNHISPSSAQKRKSELMLSKEYPQRNLIDDQISQESIYKTRKYSSEIQGNDAADAYNSISLPPQPEILAETEQNSQFTETNFNNVQIFSENYNPNVQEISNYQGILEAVVLNSKNVEFPVLEEHINHL